MSEKMDGVRAYWNGKQLLSRHGKLLSSPHWFVTQLPTNFTLDGELWMGQGTTNEDVLKVLNSTNGEWGQVGYYIFDIPSSYGTYEDRMETMNRVKPLLPP